MLYSGSNPSHLQQTPLSPFSVGKLSLQCKTTLLRPYSEAGLSLKLEPRSDFICSIKIHHLVWMDTFRKCLSTNRHRLVSSISYLSTYYKPDCS